MSDQKDYAGRFSVEVDRILERQGRAEEDGPPSEYDEMLALAERLSALDFASNSQLRRSLRRCLLTQLETEVLARQHDRWWRRLFPPMPRRALGALAGLAILVTLVGWTPAGRAVAQAVEDFVLELRWPHTTVHQVSSGQQPTPTADEREEFETHLVAGQAWELYFEGHKFGGCCYDDGPVRNEVVSLSQAMNEAEFNFQLPDFLPDGYALVEVRLLGVAPYEVFMVYEGVDRRLGLYQSLVGITSEEHPSEDVTIVESRVVGVVTDGAVEEVMVGATPAALTDGDSLTWEENNISFRLIGPGLDVETLIQVAESLAPVQ